MSALAKPDAGIKLAEGQVIADDEARAFDRSEPKPEPPKPIKFDEGIVLAPEPNRLAPFDRQAAILAALASIEDKLDTVMAQLGVKG